MEELLNNISSTIGDSSWLGPLLALLCGVLTSLMPCSLSTVPLIIGCVGGTNTKGRRALGLSLLFVLGSAIVFITLGVFASLVGSWLEKYEFWMHIILGILLVLMALQMWGVFELIPSNSIASKNRLHAGIGAFVAGLMAGLFSAHCALPTITALLAVVTIKRQVLYGLLLLLMFSIGHGALSVVAGTSVGLVQRITDSKKYQKISKIIRICLGIVIMLVALYLFCEAVGMGMHGHEH